MPDFQLYNDRIDEKESKVNISYYWIEYKQEHPAGYEQSERNLPEAEPSEECISER